MVRLNRTYYSLLKSTSKIVWYGLTVHIFSLLKLQAKFSKLSFPVKFQRIPQILRNSPTQSVNYAKFAHFVNLFYIMFQAPALAENPAEFQRITQIPHDSPTHEFRTLHTIIKTYVIDFQISDHRQRTQENWSESTRFRSIRPPITRIMRIPRILQ